MRSPTSPDVDRAHVAVGQDARRLLVSRGTPSIRGMFITLPSGRIPSAVRVPISCRADQPDRPVAAGRDDHVVPAVDGVPWLPRRPPLRSPARAARPQAVARQQLEQHLARRAVGRDAALASGRGIPQDPDPPLGWSPARSDGHRSTPRGLQPPIGEQQGGEIARAQQVGGGHVGRPVVTEIDAARADGGDQGRQRRHDESSEHGAA